MTPVDSATKKIPGARRKKTEPDLEPSEAASPGFASAVFLKGLFDDWTPIQPPSAPSSKWYSCACFTFASPRGSLFTGWLKDSSCIYLWANTALSSSLKMPRKWNRSFWEHLMTSKTKTTLLAGTYFHFSLSHLCTQGNHSNCQQHWGKGAIPFPYTLGFIFFLLQQLTKGRVRKASLPRYFTSVLQLPSGWTASAELPLRGTCSWTTGSFFILGSLSWPKCFSSSCTFRHVKLIAPRLKETRGTLTNQGLCHWSF